MKFRPHLRGKQQVQNRLGEQTFALLCKYPTPKNHQNGGGRHREVADTGRPYYALKAFPGLCERAERRPRVALFVPAESNVAAVHETLFIPLRKMTTWQGGLKILLAMSTVLGYVHAAAITSGQQPNRIATQQSAGGDVTSTRLRLAQQPRRGASSGVMAKGRTLKEIIFGPEDEVDALLEQWGGPFLPGLVGIPLRTSLFCGTLGLAEAINATTGDQEQQPARRTVRRVTPELQELPRGVSLDHPLIPVSRYAEARYTYMRDAVRDFTSRLVRRERLDGKLHGYQFIDVKVRLERSNSDRAIVPLSIFAHFLSPKKLRGRRVLYIDGKNDGKMLVRNGGTRFSYVTAKVIPNSVLAMRESRYPITEIGIPQVTKRMIERLYDDMRADPTGTNTRVQTLNEARIDGRVCTCIQVVHPKRQENITFHMAKVFVDDQLGVPIRIEGYDWPSSPDEPPRLLEEYTYTKLKLNAGLTEADFDSSTFASPTSDDVNRATRVRR